MPTTSPSNSLPRKLFLSQQVREIDSSAINTHGIEGFLLMSRAAQFSFDVLLARFPEAQHITVLCGSGNNAGDGYILAALAKQHGLETRILYLSSPDKLQGDAKKAYQQCSLAKVNCFPFTEDSLSGELSNHVIVDALLGTGLNAPVRGSYADAIKAVNESNAHILAIDIPSGLHADTGVVMGCAIKADYTATFIALKLGLFTGFGRSFSGTVCYDSLEVPENIIDEQSPVALKLCLSDLLKQLPLRPHHFHKGDCGHTLIIGGDQGYGGAVMMAAEAALRCGSGLTSVITHRENCPPLLSRTPEVMATPADDTIKVDKLISGATVIVIGPGLAQAAWSEKMLQKVIGLDKPVIMDADALNILGTKSHWLDMMEPAVKLNRIYTPHPGEAARLLSLESAKLIQNNRVAAIKGLSELLQGHILLKGSGSLVASPNQSINLCPYGNPGMASGGMGDVLSGVIGSLVAQGLELDYALNLATALHAFAADLAAKQNGERGLCATDLISVIRQVLNKQGSAQ